MSKAFTRAIRCGAALFTFVMAGAAWAKPVTATSEPECYYCVCEGGRCDCIRILCP